MDQSEFIAPALPGMQYSLFDYGALDVETRIEVRRATDEIKNLMRRAAQDIIDIGQKLIEVKARLGHGSFGAWLKAEFGWDERTAQRFMCVCQRFISDNLSEYQIAPSALYLLAAPSTPEPVRIEALELAEQGEVITHAKAQEIKARHIRPGEAVSLRHSYLDGEDVSDDESPPTSSRPALQPTPIPHAIHYSSNSSEWYTPAHIIAKARQVLGTIDLDPASCVTANEVVRAATFYSQADDGLAQPWHGNVWLNPPYGDEIGQWIERLCVAYEQDEITQAIALLPSRTDTRWFDLLSDFAICFVRGRLRFSGSDNSAPFGSIVVYLGDDHERFINAFGDIGNIWMRLDTKG